MKRRELNALSRCMYYRLQAIHIEILPNLRQKVRPATCLNLPLAQGVQCLNVELAQMLTEINSANR
jgi:hypothetical protein